MLCSWGRFLVAWFGTLAFSFAASAASIQHVGSAERDTIQFLDLSRLEADPEMQFHHHLPSPFSPPICDLKSAGEHEPSSESVPDEVMGLAPLPNLPIPVELNSPDFHPQSPAAIDDDQAVENAAPANLSGDPIFPNNGCEYELPSQADIEFSESTVPQIENPDRDKFDWNPEVRFHSIHSAWQKIAGTLGWSRYPFPDDKDRQPAMNDLVSGLVPPASFDPIPYESPVPCETLILPAAEKFEAPQEESNQLENRPETEITALDSGPETRANRGSLASLFNEASSQKTVDEGYLIPPSKPVQDPPINQQSAPSISIAPSAQSSRSLTLVFQFNHVHNHTNPIERQQSNDRLVGSGVSGISNADDSAKHPNTDWQREIFESRPVDHEYWDYYAMLEELGISFPLAENLTTQPNSRTPGRTISAVTELEPMSAPPLALTWQEIKQIPGFTHQTYRDFCDSKFFSNQKEWILETCYRIECELCGSNLLLVWNYILDSIEDGNRRMKWLLEIEAQQKEARRLRYIAFQLERFSKVLDSSARQLTFWALENEGTASAQLSTEVENR